MKSISVTSEDYKTLVDMKHELKLKSVHSVISYMLQDKKKSKKQKKHKKK